MSFMADFIDFWIEHFLTDSTSTDQDSMGKSRKKSKTKSGTANIEKNKKMGTFVSCEETGLYNFGNICYMNSAIQILRMCDSFDTKVRNSNPCTEQKVLSKLQELFSVMEGYKGKNIAYNPRDLYNVAVPPWFAPGRQQDSSEFLRHLLNTILEEELQDSRGLKPEETIAESTFGGKLKTKWKCKDCKNVTVTMETFFDLCLALPNQMKSDETSSRASSGPEILTLQDLIKTFQSKEEVQGKMKCKICKSATRTTRKTVIAKYPEYLIVTLGRFLVDEFGHAEKDIRHIEYPRTYKVSQEDEQEIYYGLTGVVVHMGKTLQSGHYCCFARHQKLKVDDKTLNDQVDVLNDEWFYLDDDFVRSSSLETLQSRVYGSKTPYILVYKRTGKSSSVDGRQEELMDTQASDGPFQQTESTEGENINHGNDETCGKEKHNEAQQALLRQNEEICLGFIPYFDDVDEPTLLGIAHLVVDSAGAVADVLQIEETLDQSIDKVEALLALLKSWANTHTGSNGAETLKNRLEWLGFKIKQEKDMQTEENDRCNGDKSPSKACTIKQNEIQSSCVAAVHATSTGTKEQEGAISDDASTGPSKPVTVKKDTGFEVSDAGVEMKSIIADFSDVSDDTLYSLALEEGYSFEALAKELQVYSIDINTTRSLFREDMICSSYSIMKYWRRWCTTSRSEKEKVTILKVAFHKIGVEFCTTKIPKTARLNQHAENVEYFPTLSLDIVDKLANNYGKWWKQLGQLLNLADYDLAYIDNRTKDERTAFKNVFHYFITNTLEKSMEEKIELLRRAFEKLGIKVETTPPKHVSPTNNDHGIFDEMTEPKGKCVIPDMFDVSDITLYSLAKVDGYSGIALGEELKVSEFYIKRAKSLYGEDQTCVNYSVMRTWRRDCFKPDEKKIDVLKGAFKKIGILTVKTDDVPRREYKHDGVVKYFQNLTEEATGKLSEEYGYLWRQLGQLLNVDDHHLTNINNDCKIDNLAFKKMVSYFEIEELWSSEDKKAELMKNAFSKLGMKVETNIQDSKTAGVLKRDINDPGVRSTIDATTVKRQHNSHKRSCTCGRNNYY